MGGFKYILVYAASGCVWALIAYVLAGAEGGIIWGGMVASPVIGVLVGLLVQRLQGLSTGSRAVVSLANLYLAACLFGVAVGVYDLATGVNAGPGWRRIPSAVVMQDVLGILWGLTFTGYFLLLWPLSYVNHALVWNLARRDRRNRR
jgi:hypothetical protein